MDGYPFYCSKCKIDHAGECPPAKKVWPVGYEITLKKDIAKSSIALKKAAPAAQALTMPLRGKIIPSIILVGSHWQYEFRGNNTGDPWAIYSGPYLVTKVDTLAGTAWVLDEKYPHLAPFDYPMKDWDFTSGFVKEWRFAPYVGPPAVLAFTAIPLVGSLWSYVRTDGGLMAAHGAGPYRVTDVDVAKDQVKWTNDDPINGGYSGDYQLSKWHWADQFKFIPHVKPPASPYALGPYGTAP